MPELKVKKMAALVLEYFRESSEQKAEVSIALPQSTSVLDSFNKMNKCLKGEVEIPMAPIPSYPKGFKPDLFVALNCPPRIFHLTSYESFKYFIALDPPSVNPGLKETVR